MHAVNQYADYWTSHNFLLGFSVSSSLSRTANFLLIQLFPIIYDFVMKGWHKKRLEQGLQPLRFLDFFDKYVWLTYRYLLSALEHQKYRFKIFYIHRGGISKSSLIVVNNSHPSL